MKEVKGVKLLAAQLDGVDMNGLRDLGDQLKEKLGEGVVVLASGNDGKVSLMATATDGAMKQGAHAGNLDQSNRRSCWRRRRRTSEHGSGRWKESGRNPRMHLQKQKKHWLIRLNKVIVKRICLWQILFWVEARKKYTKIGKNHKKQLTL